MDGEEVEFGTAGYTMEHVFVLYDRSSESVWYPEGEFLAAVGGKRRGEKLPFLDEPAPIALGEWLAQHVDSTVLLPSERDFRRMNRPLVGVRRLEEQEAGGLLIEELSPDGPAAAAGVLPGDVLIRLGETALATRGDLSGALDRHSPDETVEIEVRREDRVITLEITLGRRGG